MSYSHFQRFHHQESKKLIIYVLQNFLSPEKVKIGEDKPLSNKNSPSTDQYPQLSRQPNSKTKTKKENKRKIKEKESRKFLTLLLQTVSKQIIQQRFKYRKFKKNEEIGKLNSVNLEELLTYLKMLVRFLDTQFCYWKFKFQKNE